MGENLRILETYMNLLQSNIINQFSGISILTAIVISALSIHQSNQNFNEYLQILINKNNLNGSIISEFFNNGHNPSQLQQIAKRIAEEILKQKENANYQAINYLNVSNLTISLGMSIYLICIENQGKVRLRSFGSNPILVFIYDVSSKSIFVLNPNVPPENLLNYFSNEIEISNLCLKIKKNHGYYNSSEQLYDETRGLQKYLNQGQNRPNCSKCKSEFFLNFLCAFCNSNLCLNCAKRCLQQKCENCFYFNKIDSENFLKLCNQQSNLYVGNQKQEFYGSANPINENFYPWMSGSPQYPPNQQNNLPAYNQVVNKPTSAIQPPKFPRSNDVANPSNKPELLFPLQNTYNQTPTPTLNQDKINDSNPPVPSVRSSFSNNQAIFTNLPENNRLSVHNQVPDNIRPLANAPFNNNSTNNKKDLECKCIIYSNAILTVHKECGEIKYGDCTEKITKYFLTNDIEGLNLRKCDHVKEKFGKNKECGICKYFNNEYSIKNIESDIISLVNTIN